MKKIDVTGIERQMKKQNKIAEKYNALELKARDRVDITLEEYSQMKKNIANMSEELRYYSNFINELSIKIKLDPQILLNAEIKEVETMRSPLSYKTSLGIIFELPDNYREK